MREHEPGDKMEWKIKQQYSGQSIRDFLRKEQLFSRRILKSIIYEGGQITLNGRQVKVNATVSIGDVLAVRFPAEKKGAHMKLEEFPLDIVYEDDNLLVINKPAGMATIPSYHHPSGTLANGILSYYEKLALPYTIHIVTRLDRDTSGLVLVAKHRYSHSLLSSLQRKGEINRNYQAVVTGLLSPEQGMINKRIGRKEDSIIERMVREDGQVAITHYKTLKKTASHTLVDVRLETGRTHQIRVHFSSIGYPLAGDDLYGGIKKMIGRQALHCTCISFRHPFTHEKMTFISSIPKDMAKLIEDDLKTK